MSKFITVVKVFVSVCASKFITVVKMFVSVCASKFITVVKIFVSVSQQSQQVHHGGEDVSL